MPWLDEDHDRFVNGDPGEPNPMGWVILIGLIIAFCYWIFS